jgi:hypothetical protein
MDKFGVNENIDQEAMEKQSAKGCPICGKTPVKHGNILLCEEHGSEPFEKEKNGG